MREAAKRSADHRVQSDVRRVLQRLPTWQVEYVLPPELQDKLAELDQAAAKLTTNKKLL
ncbi:hypothetical protein [Aureimonas psammosilenae]|uniref:hypothetical protein n=1 Tax=Aureimonas psammosilenae TaxID=2495496 RepID=UPI0018698312|nr:hypothetical protein [Aureimonas psammosilenae]